MLQFEVLHRPLLRAAVGEPEEEAEDGEEDRDLPGIPEIVRDRILGQGTDDRSRDVATRTNQAIRSSALSTRRRESERSQAPSRRTMSFQKYATTATSVPRWRATSNV